MNYWIYVVGAMVMWGIWGFLPKLATQRLSYRDATIWEWVGMVVLVLPCFLLASGKPATGNGAFWIPMATGLCGLTGALLYYKAMSLSGDHTVNVIMVSALYPVISILLAFAILGQSITAGQYVGIGLCLAGSLVLGKYS